jgi:thymidylate synthase ThyX
MSTDPRRRIYLLSPRQLSPETIAVTFAKTSRSPESFRDIAEELSEEKSAAFHEKWVVGYGHASVAEHAVLHLAFEGVSRLAIECVESNRLASYTEKSTRYQKWDRDAYHVPEELAGHPLEPTYREACQALFDEYLASLAPVRGIVERLEPRRDGESDERWDGRIRARYVDVCRYYLPAAALANVGMTANARTLENAIRKMLSHPLEEVRQIGRATKDVATTEVPTLVKYSDAQPYLTGLRQRLQPWIAAATEDGSLEPVRLIRMSPSSETLVLAAALFPNADAPVASLVERVQGLAPQDQAALAEAILRARGQHDAPVRALEHTALTFEVVLDQGAYLELKRHRMMSQTPQRLTTRLGYALPRLISEAGLEERYRSSMQVAAEVFEALAAWNIDVAAYVVPNAFRRRVVLTMNLREAFHFCELRSAPNAHFSIRRIALMMAEELRRAMPLLAGYLRLPEGESWEGIEEQYFTQA